MTQEFGPKGLKTAENPNGMDVADSTGRLLLYQRDNEWAWLTKGGERNALDDFCNSFGPVVTGPGQRIRDRWVHPYSACISAGSAAYQHYRRSSSSRIGKHTVCPAR